MFRTLDDAWMTAAEILYTAWSIIANTSDRLNRELRAYLRGDDTEA